MIGRGGVDANIEKTAPYGIARVLVGDQPEVAKAYGLNGRPSAVLIQPDLTIGSSLGEKADGIRRLIRQVVAESTPALATANGSAERPAASSAIG